MKIRCLLIGVIALLVAGALASSTYAKIDLETCIGMWLFDEGSGNVAKDSSGNGNDGKLIESPKWVAGKFGKALEFDGIGSYVDCGKDDSLNIPAGGSVTMCAWVKSAVGSTGAWQAIMAKREGASYSYGINLVTNNFQVYTSGASGIQGFTYSLPIGEWVFICGTISKDPTELYVDGELFGGAAKGPGGGVAEVPANPLTIAESFGAKAAFGNAEIFNGIIDEACVFNVVLSADDINEIMSKGLRTIIAVESSDKLAATWADIKR